MTMRTASIPSKGGSAKASARPAEMAFTSSPTSVNKVYQRRNTESLHFDPTPLTNLPVAASHGAVTGLFARPIAHGQFRLLPVPLDRDPEWNARIVEWARHG